MMAEPPRGSRVLDFGCGDGELLSWLHDKKQVDSYGLENNPSKIAKRVVKGVNLIEQNPDKGLGNSASNSFDIMAMTQALQTVHYPDRILDEMLCVGRQCIITLPNFGHWHLVSKGQTRRRREKARPLTFKEAIYEKGATDCFAQFLVNQPAAFVFDIELEVS